MNAGSSVTMKRLIFKGLPLCLFLFALQASAVTIHDEAANGDLSSDPLAPTPLSFGLGDNDVSGTIQTPADTRDYFTFNIAPGQSLNSITLVNYFDVLGNPTDTGFAGIIAGTSSFAPSRTTVGDFLGTNHVIPAQIGTDILDALQGAPFGGQGFTAPLGPGDYTFLIQQTGPELTGYDLTFAVVPEPGTGVLIAGGLIALSSRRKQL